MNYGLIPFGIVCLAAFAFFLKFLLEVWASRRRPLWVGSPPKPRKGASR